MKAMTMPRGSIAFLGFVAAVMAVIAWTFIIDGRNRDRAEAEGETVRWLDVTVVEPPRPILDHAADKYAIVAFQDYFGPDSIPALTIAPTDDAGFSVSIDATTGAILFDHVRPQDRQAVDDVLKTLKVAPLNRETVPWPYSASLPADARREKVGEVSFVIPDRATGLRVSHSEGVCAVAPCNPGIGLTNGRSHIGIDAKTGAVFSEEANVLPEDQEAFDRFLAELQLDP